MTILIIDDEPLFLKTLEIKMKKEGYNVIACNNSIEALAIINTQTFDLVITDMIMPNISGADIIRLVKRKKQSIPVVVLSGLKQEESMDQAPGADQYFFKPFGLAEVALSVKKLIQLEE